MKTIARFALMLIVAFGIFANVATAALVAMTGISLGSAIPMADARYGLTANSLTITTGNNTPFWLSYHVEDSNSELFALNSVTVDISINDNLVLSEKFSTYDVGNRWNRVGFYGTNSYTDSAMNQGLILVGWGDLDSSTPYSFPLYPGDILTARMTYNTPNQGNLVTSAATLKYIPEIGSSLLAPVGLLLLLRRRR